MKLIELIEASNHVHPIDFPHSAEYIRLLKESIAWFKKACLSTPSTIQKAVDGLVIDEHAKTVTIFWDTSLFPIALHEKSDNIPDFIRFDEKVPGIYFSASELKDWSFSKHILKSMMIKFAFGDIKTFDGIEECPAGILNFKDSQTTLPKSGWLKLKKHMVKTGCKVFAIGDAIVDKIPDGDQTLFRALTETKTVLEFQSALIDLDLESLF
jgi:hypothetical protein